MHFGFHVVSKEIDARVLPIDCPACGKHSVSGRARDLRQMLLLFYVVPIFYHRPTLVDCSCGVSLLSRLRARDLEMFAAEDTARYLSVRISPILKTLVLGGLIAWLLPVIGTIWMGLTYWWARRYSGWIRSMALALFLLSLLPTGILVWSEAALSAHALQPNQALQPTRMLVTFHAYAWPAPSTRVADL